ncbi:pilin [candidate division KSB1 bacterium]
MEKIKKILPFCTFIGVLLAVLFMMNEMTFAQDVKPPTLLPAEDVDIGGRGEACIGLAQMIRTGDIHLRNIPCFVKWFTQILITLAGTLSVIFVMVGGYRYVIGTEDKKEEAKHTITYALIGLAVTLLAWIIIDLVLQVATE